VSARATDPVSPPTTALRLAQEVSYLVLTLAGRFQDTFTGHAAALDLAPAQAKVLMALQPGDSLPMRALAERVRYDPSNLTGIVDKLETRGMVRRRGDNVDRRVKALTLTELGREVRDSLWQRLAQDAGPVGHLAEAELSELRDHLRAAVGEPDPARFGAWSSAGPEQ
jgi:DNA-binding MarR family transcriptional regulator